MKLTTTQWVLVGVGGAALLGAGWWYFKGRHSGSQITKSKDVKSADVKVDASAIKAGVKAPMSTARQENMAVNSQALQIAKDGMSTFKNDMLMSRQWSLANDAQKLEWNKRYDNAFRDENFLMKLYAESANTGQPVKVVASTYLPLAK